MRGPPGDRFKKTMRDFKGMKRQRGRNRGGGGGSNGGKPQHNANRSFESNGPENVKVRGPAQTVFEKYQQLARDAASAGDRVLAENYLQHAEHYFRVVRAVQPNRPVAEIIGRDQIAAYDIDFEAEPDENEIDDQQPQASENDGDGRREDRGREPQPIRDDRPRDERPRDDRPRDDRSREDRPRDERRFENGRRDRWRDRNDRPRETGDRVDRETPTDPLAVVDPLAQPTMPIAVRDPSEVQPPAYRLRGQDGTVSEAPAFLNRAAPLVSELRPDNEAPIDEAAKRPRRRRVTKSVDQPDSQAESEDA